MILGDDKMGRVKEQLLDEDCLEKEINRKISDKRDTLSIVLCDLIDFDEIDRMANDDKIVIELVNGNMVEIKISEIVDINGLRIHQQYVIDGKVYNIHIPLNKVCRIITCRSINT